MLYGIRSHLYRVMNRVTAPDALGGVTERWEDSGEPTLFGGLIPLASRTARTAGAEAERQRAQLYHDRDRLLKAGQRLLDEDFGTVWTVAEASVTPDTAPESRLRLAITLLERVVDG